MKKLVLALSMILLSACETGWEKQFSLYGDEMSSTQPQQMIRTETYDSSYKPESMQYSQSINPQSSDTDAYSNTYLNNDNMYMIDKTYKYDAWNDNKTFTDEELRTYAEKWRESNVSTRYQDYHGNVVKIDTLRNARDLREMRLRFYYGENDGYNDGDINHVIDQVAKSVMRQACGRGAEDTMIVYDRPGAEVRKPTAFYGYQIIETGVSVREYGFRCIYPNHNQKAEFNCGGLR